MNTVFFNPNINYSKNILNKPEIQNNNNHKISNKTNFPNYTMMGTLLFKSSKHIFLNKIQKSASNIENPIVTVSNLLKKPMEEMKEKGIYNPEVIDNTLTSYVGKDNVRNIPFHLSEDQIAGKTKSYLFEDGSIFNLEAHISKRGPVIRLYRAFEGRTPIQNKNDRHYIDNNGHFARGTYSKTYTHLKSDSSCKEWIKDGQPVKPYNKKIPITITNLPSGIPKKPIEIVGEILNQSKSQSSETIYNPDKIDKLLTSKVGKENAKDITFSSITNAGKNIVNGRARKYTIEKTSFVLESYVNENCEPQTRLYVFMQDGKILKQTQRVYAKNDGNFTAQANSNSEICLKSDSSTIDWINSKVSN